MGVRGIERDVDRGVGFGGAAGVLVGVVGVVVGAILTVCGVAAVIELRPSVYLLPVLLVAVATVLAFGLGAGLLRVLRAPRAARWGALARRGGQLACGGATAGLTLVVAIVVGLATAYRTHWDPAFVMGSAGRVLDGTVDAEMIQYLESFPNNLLLLSIDQAQLRLARATGLDITTVVVVSNAALVAVLSWCVFLVVRRLADTAAGLLAQLAVLMLVGINPTVVVPYTDLPAAAAGAVGACALTYAATSGAEPWRRAAGIVVAGAALGLAAAIKPTMLGPAAGAVLAFAIVGGGRGRGRGHGGGGDRGGDRGRLTTRLVGAGVLAAAIAAAFLVVGHLGSAPTAADGSAMRADRAWTPRMYLAQGLAEHDRGDRTFYGSYDQSLVEASIGHTTAELDVLATNRITATISARGWVGMARFEADKLIWTWGDGTWFAYGEGGDGSAKPIADSAFARWVQRWNSVDGQWSTTRFAMAQGVWAALLIAGGLGQIRAARRPAAIVLGLPLLGGIAWAQLFEGRSRYLLGYAVWIVAVAFLGSTRRESTGRGSAGRGAAGGATVTREPRVAAPRR